MIDVRTKDGNVHIRRASGKIEDLAADIAIIVKSLFDKIKDNDEEQAYTFIDICADVVNFVRCVECDDKDEDVDDDEDEDDDDDADDFIAKLIRILGGEV